MVDKPNIFINTFHKMLDEDDFDNARDLIRTAPMSDLKTLNSNFLHVARALAIIKNPDVVNGEQLVGVAMGEADFWGPISTESKEKHWKELLQLLEKEKGMRPKTGTGTAKTKTKAEKPPKKVEKEEEVEEPCTEVPATLLYGDPDREDSGDDSVFKDGEEDEETEEEAEESLSAEDSASSDAAEPEPESPTLDTFAYDCGAESADSAAAKFVKMIENVARLAKKLEGKIEEINVPKQEQGLVSPDLVARVGTLETIMGKAAEDVRDVKGICVILGIAALQAVKDKNGKPLYKKSDLSRLATGTLREYEQQQEKPKK